MNISASRRGFLLGAAALGVVRGGSAAETERADGERLSLARTLSVNYDVDVFVAGGGPAGVCAAVAASRAGKSVFLAESSGAFGGAATAAGVPLFAAFEAEGERDAFHYTCDNCHMSAYGNELLAADRAAVLTEKLRRMKADYPNMKFILGASPYYGQPMFDEFNARMLRLVDNRTYFWAEGTASLQGRLERRDAMPRRAGTIP